MDEDRRYTAPCLTYRPQAYWVYNALTAMEYGLDTLPGGPSWDVVATNAFNLFADRWNTDSDTCNGGLKWQYDPKANGWTVSLLSNPLPPAVIPNAGILAVQERRNERRFLPDGRAARPLHGQPDVRGLGHQDLGLVPGRRARQRRLPRLRRHVG